VVATHWHDDHIAGLASIIALSPKAEFCCSSAIRSDEFLTLVATAPETISGHSGVDELAAILSHLQARGDEVVPIFGIKDRTILNLPVTGRFFPVTLTALSPSDLTFLLALKQIASIIPKEDEPQRRIIKPTPNHASLVLSLEAGGRRALLGADLEHTGSRGEGWTAVLNAHHAPPAKIFKVPHHGSSGADYPDVWTKMLESDPIAVVTPFALGRVKLPKTSDLERLSARTRSLYCTAQGSGKSLRRDPAVEREQKLKLSNLRVLEGQPGQVRIRWSTSDPTALPEIKLFNGAYKVPNSTPPH